MVNGRSNARHHAHREGRRLALAALFEAEFGQRTAGSALERQVELGGTDPEAVAYAHELIGIVVAERDRLDELIARYAPAYPVTQLARIDRSLLRSAIGELLHSATTPAGVAISEWVELAREYSGEPARRLVNGVLGRIAKADSGTGSERATRTRGPGPTAGEGPVSDEGSAR
ncbi:MAG TPA: transcription antitermination factor NusB [Candidatus Limnocylindrales bacterium]|jgi:N utilization substance protein B|nr:transcription antitermination factor NusB [Candidatus Limnocylindrales bacterium]